MTGVPANRAHLPPSEWTDERIARLKEMHADGMAYSLIGAAFGVSRGAISGKIDRLGLTGRARATSIRASKVRVAKSRTNADRSATQRIAKKLRVRSESNGGTQIVDCVVREEAPQPADFLSITFADLEPSHCKFPRGGDGGKPIVFCGQPRMSGEPYCRNCCAVAFTYTPPPKREYHPLGRSKPAVF
jgi:GcrA cell cycle regulator